MLLILVDQVIYFSHQKSIPSACGAVLANSYVSVLYHRLKSLYLIHLLLIIQECNMWIIRTSRTQLKQLGYQQRWHHHPYKLHHKYTWWSYRAQTLDHYYVRHINQSLGFWAFVHKNTKLGVGFLSGGGIYVGVETLSFYWGWGAWGGGKPAWVGCQQGWGTQACPADNH